MGRTFAESFTANHTVAKDDLFILEHFSEKADIFRALGFKHASSVAGSWISQMDLIILAVKPQDAAALYPAMAPHVHPGQVILSIMAGVKIETIKNHLPTTKIVRAMPNLPAQIGMGMTGFTSDPSVSMNELFEVHNLLNTTGKSLYFDKEEMLDAVTAISGSGPAYVFYFMEAMRKEAEKMGFTEAQADVLIEQTFLGAIHLIKAHNLPVSEWINRVASKGGTTIAAIETFDAHGVAEKIGEGLEAARSRAEVLGKISA